MTRTRTQTALTKLVEMVANIHGETELVERLLTEGFERSDVLAARLLQLKASRDALYATLRLYDADLDPSSIGTSEQWMRRYGRQGSSTVLRRYLQNLDVPCHEKSHTFERF